MRCERVQVGRIRWTVRLRNQRWRRTPPNLSGLPANYILRYPASSNAPRYCSRRDGASAANTDFREGRVRPQALIPCSHRCDQSSDCANESGERCQYPRKSKPKRRLFCCRSLLWSSLSLLAYRPSLRRWFWQHHMGANAARRGLRIIGLNLSASRMLRKHRNFQICRIELRLDARHEIIRDQ
jgi:hypothetical protein